MAEAVDGEFQKLSATDGLYNREQFFSKYPQLAALVANLSDAEIDALPAVRRQAEFIKTHRQRP